MNETIEKLAKKHFELWKRSFAVTVDKAIADAISILLIFIFFRNSVFLVRYEPLTKNAHRVIMSVFCDLFLPLLHRLAACCYFRLSDANLQLISLSSRALM